MIQIQILMYVTCRMHIEFDLERFTSALSQMKSNAKFVRWCRNNLYTFLTQKKNLVLTQFTLTAWVVKWIKYRNKETEF